MLKRLNGPDSDLMERMMEYCRTMNLPNAANMFREFIYGLKPRLTSELSPFDLNYVAPYDKNCGFLINLEKVVNAGDKDKYL